MSLQNITIPNNVNSIGMLAFRYCKSLKTVVIPDSVTDIGDKAFNRCFELEKVVFSDKSRIIDKIQTNCNNCSKEPAA